MDQLIKCRRCSMEKAPHKTDQHLCEDCVKAENNRVSFYRQHNFNWLEVSKEAELELWERQPAETDHEWSVWLRYRDAYPSKKPSYRQVAEDMGTTINAVKKIGQRWTFSTRMQAWAKHIDDITVEQRRQEVLNMNKKHVDMAAALHNKLQTAINQIDPYALSPREISSLMKMSTELERKAMLDNVPAPATVALEDDNPELKKMDVKSGNISEILQVLNGAGVLSNFGVRQTTTTEVVVKDE